MKDLRTLSDIVSGDSREPSARRAAEAEPGAREWLASAAAWRDAARQGLFERAPNDLLVAPVRTPGFAGVVAGLVAAGLLVAALGGLEPPGAQAVHVMADQALAASVPATDGVTAEELAAHFAEQGIPHGLSMVADLRSLGLDLVGGVVVEHPVRGTLVVYEKDGVRYVCQMFRQIVGGGRPDRVVDTARGIDLRGYRGDGHSTVVYRDGDMICAFTALVELDKLLALVQAKLAAMA